MMGALITALLCGIWALVIWGCISHRKKGKKWP